MARFWPTVKAVSLRRNSGDVRVASIVCLDSFAVRCQMRQGVNTDHQHKLYIQELHDMYTFCPRQLAFTINLLPSESLTHDCSSTQRHTHYASLRQRRSQCTYRIRPPAASTWCRRGSNCQLRYRKHFSNAVPMLHTPG